MEVEQDHMVMSGKYEGQEGDACHRGEMQERVIE